MEMATSPAAIDAGISIITGRDLSEVKQFRIEAGARGFADTRSRGLSSRKDRVREAALLLPPMMVPLSRRKALDMISHFSGLKPTFRQPLSYGDAWGGRYVPSEISDLDPNASFTDHLEALLRACVPGGSFHKLEKELGQLRWEVVVSAVGVARMDFMVCYGDSRQPKDGSGIFFGDWEQFGPKAGMARMSELVTSCSAIGTAALLELGKHIAGNRDPKQTGHIVLEDEC